MEDEDEDPGPTKRQRAGGRLGKLTDRPERPNDTYLKRVVDTLQLAYGKCVVNTKAAAKKLDIPHESVCWGFMCSNKKATKAYWKGNCEGGQGHETFDSKLHKAALNLRSNFQKLDRSDSDVYAYPFRKPTVQ